MRKCCCCISVHTGSVILGFIGIVLATLELVALIPYLLDVDDFNPIKEHLNHTFYIFDDFLQKSNFNFTEETRTEILQTARQHIWTTFLSETCMAGVYVIMSLLLVVGVQCRKRALMLPYMIIQMILIVIFLLAGLVLMIVMFFLGMNILGAVCTCVLVVINFLFFYFWFVVQKAYAEIGNRDYMYSPAPVKPIYNPGNNYHHNHPTAPQQFQME